MSYKRVTRVNSTTVAPE